MFLSIMKPHQFATIITLLFLVNQINLITCQVLTFECDEDQYFDTLSQTCQSCLNNATQIPTKHGCICKPGYEKDESKFPNFFGYQDKDICIVCSGPGCNCLANEKQSFHHLDGSIKATKECLACSTNSYPSSNYIHCQPCPHYSQTYDTTDKKCKCPEDNYVTAGVSCVTKKDLTDVGADVSVDKLSLAYRIKYYTIPQIGTQEKSSAVFKYYYLRSAVGCTKYLDTVSCQILANLCVLQLYDVTTYVCRLYLAKSDLQTQGDNSGQRNHYPWLYYDTGNVYAIINDANFQARMTFDPTQEDKYTTMHYLEYWAAIFNIDGTFEDWIQITDEFIFCPHTVDEIKQYRSFGTNYINKCFLYLDTYVSLYKMKFFELYIKDMSGEYKEMPVLITNLRDANGEYPNKQTNKELYRFTRRFFLVDTISSVEGEYNQGGSPTVIRVATNIRIVTTLQQNSDERIYIPYIQITYEERQIVAGVMKNSQAEIIYQSNYNYEPQRFWTVVLILFIILNIFIFFRWALKVWVWTKYNPSDVVQTNDTSFTTQIVLYSITALLETWADSVFYFLFIITGYWFVFFKMQSKAYVLIPIQETFDTNYKPFNVIFYIMFVCKVISIYFMIKRQTQVDILFMDWEKQKKYADPEDNKRGVSVWRTLFMANEFNELSCIRTVSLEWTLMALGFFLSGLKWENLAAETPNMTTSITKIETNYILKYFVSQFVFMVTGVTQIIVRKLFQIWNPLKIQDYADLCSISNISILILDQDLHGYYLHGKAPTQIAEGNAKWLQQALIKEGQLGQNVRGLSHSEDIQIYEIIIPTEIRTLYEKQYAKKKEQVLIELQNLGQQYIDFEKAVIVQEPAKDNANEKQSKNNVEKIKQDKELSEYMNLLLQLVMKDFVEQVAKKDPPGREKSIWQRLFDYPPQDPLIIKEPQFFRDREYNIQSLFFLGQEMNLLIANVVCFNFFDILTGSTLISIVGCYFINQFFLGIRNEKGQQNISDKTFIDEKFLI